MHRYGSSRRRHIFQNLENYVLAAKTKNYLTRLSIYVNSNPDTFYTTVFQTLYHIFNKQKKKKNVMLMPLKINIDSMIEKKLV